MTERAEIEKLGVIDPELAEVGGYLHIASLLLLTCIYPQVLKAMDPLPPMNWNDAQGLRASIGARELEGVKALGPVPPELKETDLEITMRDGHKAVNRLSQPTQPSSSGSPLIVLIHGGAFILGSPAQTTAQSRMLVKLFGAVVVSLKYRLAPEDPWPYQANDCWDSVAWLAANTASIGADLSKGFIVGGVSAGGNLAAVVGQKALDDGLSPPITGLWLSVPALLDSAIVPEKYKDVWFSYWQNADAPILSKAAMDATMGHWKPDIHSPLFSPFNSLKGPKGLPPTYFQVCGLDPLRDDGLVYEKELKANGVATRLDVYPGLPHGGWGFFPDLKQSKKFIVDTAKGYAWLLKTQVDDKAIAESVVKPRGPNA